MPDAADQKGAIFDQTDVLGLIIPGGALIFGGALLFTPFQSLEPYACPNLGTFGIVILGSLVAGQCLRVIAWTYFDKMRKSTPRRAFEDIFKHLADSERTRVIASAEHAFALRLAHSSHLFVGLSLFSHIYTLVRTYNAVEYVDRMERQFRMVSGLFAASVLVGIGYVFRYGTSPASHIGKSAFLYWLVFVAGLIALFFPAQYKNAFSQRVPSALRWYIVAIVGLLALVEAFFSGRSADVDSHLMVLLGLLALAVFLYVGSIRYANAVASTLIITYSAIMREHPTPESHPS